MSVAKEEKVVHGADLIVVGNEIKEALAGKQNTLVSGTNIKTVNNASLLGSGNVAVQPTLVSGTNIKTVNGESLLGSGNVTISKIGTATVGSTRRPIYLNSGAPSPVSSVASDYVGWPYVSHYGLSSLENLFYTSGANTFAYLNTNYVDVEYSNDGGETWLDSEYSTTQKIQVFTYSGGAFRLGHKTTDYTTSDSVRITIHTGCGVYCLSEFLVIKHNFAGEVELKIEKTSFADQNTYVEHSTAICSGNPGYRIIPLSAYLFGNNGIHDLRITATYIGPRYPTITHYIGEIKLYASNVYNAPSTYSKTGHLYSIDAEQSATFPAKVRASNFIKSGGTSSQFLKADGSVDSNSYAKTSALSGYLPLSGGTLSGDLTIGGDYGVEITQGEDTSGVTVKADSDTTIYGLSKIENYGATLTLPQTGGTIALLSDIPSLSNYLPLTGGALTGNLNVGLVNNEHVTVSSEDVTITNSDGYKRIYGLTSLDLYDPDEDTTTYLRLPSQDGTLALTSQIPDISGKQDKLVSGSNIKTINDTSILGSGNITIKGEKGDKGDMGLIPSATSQPSGGMLPNVYYDLGTLTGDTTFSFNTTGLDSTVLNHWFFVFTTPATAPTITWPSEITDWFSGSAPTIAANTSYQVSVIDGLAVAAEY